jgi:hypothetical protein
MTTVSVSREFDASPEVLWELVRDFGNCSWMPRDFDVTAEGDSIGMVRVVRGTMRETLVARDPQRRMIRYTVDDETIPYPVTGYCATMEVQDAGGRARLVWSCDATPEPTAVEAEVKARIERGYEMMFDWIEQRLGTA